MARQKYFGRRSSNRLPDGRASVREAASERHITVFEPQTSLRLWKVTGHPLETTDRLKKGVTSILFVLLVIDVADKRLSKTRSCAHERCANLGL